MNRNTGTEAAELLRLLGQVEPPRGAVLDAARATLLAAIAAVAAGPASDPELAAGRAPEQSAPPARRRPAPPDPAARRQAGG